MVNATIVNRTRAWCKHATLRESSLMYDTFISRVDGSGDSAEKALKALRVFVLQSLKAIDDCTFCIEGVSMHYPY